MEANADGDDEGDRRAQGARASTRRTCRRSTCRVDPRYDDQGQRDPSATTRTNSVSAIVRDLAQVGDVIDAAVAAGANNVSGPSLSREDQDKLYRDALENAVAEGDAEGERARARGGPLARRDPVAERGDRRARGRSRTIAFAANARRRRHADRDRHDADHRRACASSSRSPSRARPEARGAAPTPTTSRGRAGPRGRRARAGAASRTP